MSDGPTPREQLLYVAAQQFEDETAVFTGFHWPIVAARVARKLHASNLISVFEAGITYRGCDETLATSTTEVGVFDGHVDMYGSSLDSLHTFLKSNRLDGAVLDAANVDRFGNINSSAIGDPDDPAVRLPGPGGANDIMSYQNNVTLISGVTDSERFRDRVSYVSSPGHIDGDGSREAAGFPDNTGPARLITPFGVFNFDETGRAQLFSLAQDVTVEDVREATGWNIPDEDYDSAPVPDEDELAIIREVLTEASNRGYRSVRS